MRQSPYRLFAMDQNHITNLPLEVLQLILHQLPAQDFLAFCSTCHTFQDSDDLRFCPSYWRSVTRATFRVPNRPVVASDGKRWMHLYRRMLTQTRVYLWGNNDGGALGYLTKPPPDSAIAPLVPAHRVARPRRPHDRGPRNWPVTSEITEEVVADLQCGGWCTAVLTAKGDIRMNGCLDGSGLLPLHPKKLCFPSDFQEEKGSTTISQFSVGRSHILALADNHQVWSWSGTTDPAEPAKPVKLPVDYATVPGDDLEILGSQKISKVVAGWSRSSAYRVGTGIIVWEPLRVSDPLSDAESRPPVLENILVVRESEHRIMLKSHGTPSSQTALEQRSTAIGEVTNWILLSSHVVFVTHLGKAFAANIVSEYPLDQATFRIRGPSKSAEDAVDPEDFIVDVHGAHESFALLKRNGEVLTTNEEYLSRLWQRHRYPENASSTAIPKISKIPALQHTGVIQVAFGDWHFHALHSDGTISSYGKEPHFCGTLGLGGAGIDAVRGIKGQGFGMDGQLLPQCSMTGRRVTFESEKRAWLDHVRNGGKDRKEALERMDQAFQDDEKRAEVSEWFEHRLRNWDNDAPAPAPSRDGSVKASADDGLGAYFALSVAAAGWHSGALMLVNEDKAVATAERYRTHARAAAGGSKDAAAAHAEDKGTLLGRLARYALAGLRYFLGLPARTESTGKDEAQAWAWAKETFPRLRLRSGEVMPGQVPVLDWACPEWRPVEEVDL